MDGVIIRGDLMVTPVVDEYVLTKAYVRMAEDGTLDTVFSQGVPTVRHFLEEYLTMGKRVTLGCFRQPRGEPEFCGLGWVFGTQFLGKKIKAETGMVFFRNQSVKTDNVTFGKMMMESFFSRYNVDYLFGLTPEPNKLAVRYAKRLGMWTSEPIPDYCSWRGRIVPGIISHISKDQWFERNRTA